ncbi:hypothetical protein ACFPN2_27590 [Steroidobacter flavus]|uniref:SMP-30/Gluconolactonase/LRE-like region domain-containing protein n=1 Tax=Steroidobacter flavus TaxID=1842136 RepID=A0ABV8T1V3_9GAMM
MILSLAVGAIQPAASDAPSAECTPTNNLRFICGAERPEDVARIPATRWLVFSGFSNGAGLKLVDSSAHSMRLWYSGAPDQIQHDRQSFPRCASPPHAETFNAQGISLRTVAPSSHRLYVVNHGGRESIEVFSIDARVDEPKLSWIGCVLLPDGVAANSVATFSDGTILASVLTHPGTSITDFVLGKTTGGVYEWRPGAERFHLLKGTELPGNNGIETSLDDREFYVVAFGWRSVVVFSRADPSKPARRAVAPGFMPDNIHWHEGRLLLAGMQVDEPACGGLRKIVDGKADGMLCHRGYGVAQLDPTTLQFKLIAYDGPDPAFNGVSAALLVDNDLWLASYQSDRVAVRKLSYSLSP